VTQKVSVPPTAGWEIQGLASQGPDPELKEKLALFGQFVGDWDIVEDRYLEADGMWTRGKGELHWRWILGGRALQDVWASTNEETGELTPDGTTIRFYDPKIDAWRSTWISPTQGAVKTFIGRPVGKEVVLEGKSPEGFPISGSFPTSPLTRSDGILKKPEMRGRAGH
jgi:hypothetical protein